MTVVTQILMAPPGPAPRQINTIRGVVYKSVAGTFVAMPPYDADLAQANGWSRCGDGYGTTANRPTVGLYPGFKYNDSSLSITAIWDGKTWRNSVTGVSV